MVTVYSGVIGLILLAVLSVFFKGFGKERKRKRERKCLLILVPSSSPYTSFLISTFLTSLSRHSVQFSCSVVSHSLRPHGLQHARLPCPSPTPGVNSKLMSIELVMPSNHFILCRPLLLLLAVFPSNRDFSSESVLRIRWPKYWSFSFSISPSNEYSGLIFL